MIIKNGYVLDPESRREGTMDIRIQDGVICEIGPDLQADGEEIVDAAGLTVAPGLIDGHVHFRDPGLTYKENIETGAAAAAAGGFTTVICMANTKPPVDTPDTLSYVLQKGESTGIRVMSCAAVTKGMEGRELADLEALARAGAVGFTDDGKPILDEKLAVAAMEKAKALGLPLSFHEEDPAFIVNNGINAGEAAKKLGIEGSPAVAEDVMVARDCMLALYTGARINVQHISSAHSVALVRAAKEMGADVWAEATPHHFTLTEDAVLQYGTLAKMNPPLRTEADRQAIIRGLKDGTIDMIATDHAPHSREEKNLPLTKAPSGIIGLETSLALGITQLVHGGHLTMMELMEKMSLNTANMYHLDLGKISVGKPADLVIFDENESWKPEQYVSRADNTPFTGMELTGKVKCTICKGKIVYQESRT